MGIEHMGGHGRRLSVTLYHDDETTATEVATAIRRLVMAIHAQGDTRGCTLEIDAEESFLVRRLDLPPEPRMVRYGPDGRQLD